MVNTVHTFQTPTVRALDTEEDLAYWCAAEYAELLNYFSAWRDPGTPRGQLIRTRDDIHVMLQDEFGHLDSVALCRVLGDILSDRHFPFERAT